MTENKRYRKVMGLIENTDGKTFDLTEIENLLNEQEETIQELKKELKNRKKLNTILEGFLLDKGYDFNDIIKFLQDRTEKREGE